MTKVFGAVLAGAVFATTGLAVAACPVAADLEAGGIRFIGPDGTDELHRRISDTQVQMDLIEAGVPGTYRSIMIHGVYIQWLGATLEDGSIDHSASVVFARDIAPEDMPLPVPGLEWSTPQQYVSIGYEATDETMTIAVADPANWVLGSCTLEVYPVTITTVVPGDTYVEGINYIPALGTAVLVSYRDSQVADTYSFVDIAAEPE